MIRAVKLLFVIEVVCKSIVLGQTPDFFTVWELDSPPTPILTQVKTIKKYVSLPGVIKLRPKELVLVADYDAKGRLINDVSYLYSESIFGKDTTIVKQEYVYFNDSNNVWIYKKHQKKIVDRRHYNRSEGAEFDKNGKRVNFLFFNSAGGVDTVSIDKLQDSVMQANSYHRYRNDSQQALDALDPKNVENDSLAGRPISPVRNSARWVISEMPPSNIIYEPTLEGYVLKEVSNSGQVLAEQRVKLNENFQPLQIINALNSQNRVNIYDYLYDAEGRMIKLIIKNKRGKLVKQYECIYNNTGYLLKTILQGRKDKILNETIYEYELY